MQYFYWKHTYPLKRVVDTSLVQFSSASPHPAPQTEAIAYHLSHWLDIPDIRQQRYYLATHKELLDQQSDSILSNLIQQSARYSRREYQLREDLALVQDVRVRGRTEEAINEAYINIYGGLAIDLPPWLQDVERRLGDLLSDRQRLQTGEQRMTLLLDTLQHIQQQEPMPYMREIQAILQRELSVAWSEYTRAKRAQAFERAIQLCEEVLQVYTLSHYPRQYAEAQILRGTLYMDRILGNLPKNQEQALACYQEALRVFKLEVCPIEYAEIQAGLGVAFQYRRTGEKRANQEQALACYQEALRIFSSENFPHDYARAQNYLGTAYWQREMGERRENMEQAIICLQKALPIWTQDTFPIHYARLQHNLGLMHLERIAGDKRENLEKAITYAHNALSMLTRDAFPVQHGQGLLNLGSMYLERIAGDKRENLEQAIACFQRALLIRTYEAFPNEYAVTQTGLAKAYQSRIEGEKRENLQKAITCYRESLRVWTLDMSPHDARNNNLGLAELEAEYGDWSAAHTAYEKAIEAEDFLVILGSGIPGQDSILKEGRDAAVRNGYILYRLGRIEEAAVSIERGRARGLAEALAFDAADPSSIQDKARRDLYTLVRQTLIAAQAEMNMPLPQDVDDERHRHLELKRMTTFRQAKDAFDQMVNEIREAQDPADFLNAPFASETILSAAESIGPGHALVYLVATPWGGVALAACSRHCEGRSPARFAALDLPNLTEELVMKLAESRLTDNSGRIIGGFALAQTGRGFEQMLQHWDGETLQECADKLHKVCHEQQQISTLDAAMQEALTRDLFATLAGYPLSSLSREERGLLAETLAETLLRYELRSCLDTFSKAMMHPLVSWLSDQSITSMIIVPCGYLATFPLTSAILPDGRTVSSALLTSVAPNARVLLRPRGPYTSREGVYALGDPAGNLQWSEAEALTLAAIARQWNLTTSARIKHEATRNWLLTALQAGNVVDASCHGTFDYQEVLHSALHLARKERITMGEMLSYQVDLRGLRLLMLSACQTAIFDLEGARNEMRNLAAAMLQAGATAVLASLWAVDDKATYLLMVRFAQEWFPHMETEAAAAALARAQAWLRSVTNAELQSWQSTMPSPPKGQPAISLPSPTRLMNTPVALVRGRAGRFGEDDAQLVIRIRAEYEDPLDRPYADPYYWAGFQLMGW